MRKINLTSNFDNEKYDLIDGDVIRIPPHVQHINHICCSCGAKHKWFIKAKKNRVIILRPYRIEDGSNTNKN